MSTQEKSGVLRRLAPQSVFKRFLLIALAVALLTASAAMGVSWWIGRDMVFKLHEDSGYTLLRNAVDMIGRTRMAVDEMRWHSLNEHKQALESVNAHLAGMLDGLRRQVGENALVSDPSSQASIRGINNILGAMEQSVFLSDSDGRILAHHDPALVGRLVDVFKDADGEPAHRRLIEKIGAAREEETVFTIHYHPGDNGEGREPWLAAVRQYRPWNLILVSEAPLKDFESKLAEKNHLAFEELRARINEIVIGNTGYVYVFDKNCGMLVHPTLVGEDFASLKTPGRDTRMCDALKATAEKTWGENTLVYQWDRPDSPGRYEREKISWCAREPSTGWYVCVSMYLSEILETLPTFMTSIFLPALGSILLFMGVMALSLKNLLRPVKELAEVCRRVYLGDLNVQAPKDVYGEVGFLCRQFNTMVLRIRGLRQKDEQRRQELEQLNANLEKMVRVRTHALERKTKKLESANIRLKELDELKSAFLSSVSHELRTPLTSIMGFAKLIQKDVRKARLFAATEPDQNRKAERVDQNLDVIVTESERLSRLINDFLNLAKIESGRMQWNDEPMRLQDATDAAMAALSAVIQTMPDVRVIQNVPSDLPSLRVDKDRIIQVLVNLVGNALKFTKSGRVALTARAAEGWIQLRVCDTGPGIAHKDLLLVFDKFQQATQGDTALNKPQGTGLGLAISRQIVEHYGGSIWAESGPGSGVDIVVELPGGGAEEQTSLSSRTSAVEEPVRSDQEARVILVVDDDLAIREYLTQLFVEEGYQVLSASDGCEGLAMAASRAVDLIVMDIMMPCMDGKTAMARLRSDPSLSRIPIVVLSVLSGEEAAGGDATLSKPVKEDQLLDTVRALLQEKPVTQPCMVVAGQGQEQSGSIRYWGSSCGACSPDSLPSMIEQGFLGVLFIPAALLGDVNLDALVDHEGVHVVVSPSSGVGGDGKR
jgi:signal transduction histidine kinase/CheY-like chemotaxis protein